jgi:hypothetical protein
MPRECLPARPLLQYYSVLAGCEISIIVAAVCWFDVLDGPAASAAASRSYLQLLLEHSGHRSLTTTDTHTAGCMMFLNATKCTSELPQAPPRKL